MIERTSKNEKKKTPHNKYSVARCLDKTKTVCVCRLNATDGLVGSFMLKFWNWLYGIERGQKVRFNKTSDRKKRKSNTERMNARI